MALACHATVGIVALPGPPDPDENGDIWLTRGQAAWLLQASTEQISRLERKEALGAAKSPGKTARYKWRDLVIACERENLAMPLNPEWLGINSGDPLPSMWRQTETNSAGRDEDVSDTDDRASSAEPGEEPEQDAQSLKDEVEKLRTRCDTMLTQLREAKADAENADVAAMAYHDNWMRARTPRA
jgi:hypothetical protein